MGPPVYVRVSGFSDSGVYRSGERCCRCSVLVWDFAWVGDMKTWLF